MLPRMMVAVVALFGYALAWATPISGGTYAITSSTIASGVGPMTGGTHTVSSSLGDLSGPPMAHGSYQLYPGFWSAYAGAIVIPSSCLLDIDGNGVVDALTDGVLIVRALLGLTGTAVTNGAVGAGAPFTAWADIQPRIHATALDIDGNGTPDASTDGVLIVRAMFGLTGANVTNGAVASGAPRASWAAVRNYLNANCGGNFAP